MGDGLVGARDVGLWRHGRGIPATMSTAAISGPPRAPAFDWAAPVANRRVEEVEEDQ